MIEAVNASLSTASAVRAVAQQVSSAESLTANPARIQKAAVSTAYSSKYVELAPDIKPIFILRDTDTGESIRQFPTESQIRAYQRAQQSRDAAAANAAYRQQRTAEAVNSGATEEAAQLVESSVQFREVRKEIKKSDTPPAPLPGQTRAEIKTEGDTGGEVPASTGFTADV